MMDKLQHWWYESNAKKSTGGLVFMCVAGAAFAGVMIWIFMQ